MSKDDPRFKEFSVNPRFRSVPKKTKKVHIDPRFKDVFNEKFAGPSVSIDKRGRSKKAVGDTGDDLKRFYALEDGSSSEEDEPEKELKGVQGDWSRGETILTDSSSEESGSDEESDLEDEEEESPEEVFDKWGELDGDAERTNAEATRRLAICNMDWDRVGAKDLYLALSSFLPTSGTLNTVKVYLSDFGAERTETDDALGPQELRAKRNKELTEEEMNERIRQYQINRLKYYYAIAEFDSPSSASKVYEECDGMEFELSACRFDLRFVPGDVDFNEREPKEICDSPPQDEKYEAKSFETAALQKGKVDLTWDETDPKRAALIRKAFEDDSEEDDETLRELIHNSEDDDDDIMEGNFEEDEEDAVAKYRALLADVKESNQKKEEEKHGGNMQITWNPDADKKKASSKELTPWEEYLEKCKSKQQSKREARKAKSKEAETQAFSDDEVPDGFDDPFFNQDPLEEDQSSLKKKSKSKKGKKADPEEVDPDLNLLVMDEEDNKHFDYKEIVKTESAKGKKKKKSKQQKSAEEESGVSSAQDDFSLDLQDPRFQAIFDDPDYNVDPSHPNFKKTKSMKEIITEKQKRILQTDENGLPAKKRKASQVSEIDKLVKSVKMNTHLKFKKKKK